MKRHYETCVVYDGTLPEETVAKERDNFQTFIKDNAEFDSILEWGKRPLAYEIKKKKNGVYYVFIFVGENEMPAKIDKHFKLNASVLRHMTTVYDPKKPIKPKPREEGEGQPDAEAGERREEKTNE